MLIVGGLVGGLIGGVLHAIATVGFGVDQIISGVAINILAPGITKYLSGIYFTTPKALAAGGGPTQSPKVDQFNALNWHGADDALGKIEDHHWFFVSDVAGLLDGIVTSLDVFTHHRAAADPAHLVRAVAHVVRAAAALVRREPDRGRDAGREGLHDEGRPR